MRRSLFFVIFFCIAYQCFACMGEEKHQVDLSSGKVIVFNNGDLYNNQAKAIYNDQNEVRNRLKNEGESLSDTDIDILTDFISRGLSVIEQTEQQYLEKMKQIIPECPSWEQIERKGKWTAYKETPYVWIKGQDGFHCDQPQC